jgi:2-oxoacid:acceptor oxidoreductase gamma subunit (pyruvate/2-ketoisovalerate family)
MSNARDIIEIVIYGRGGQGCVLASQIIVEAAYISGNFKDVIAFPSFGAERRGAPIQAFARISKNKKIWTRAEIEHPDIAIVLDETVLTSEIIKNIKENGMLIINSDKTPEEIKEFYKITNKIIIASANITKFCIDKNAYLEDLPILNTPILGVLSEVIDSIDIGSMKKAIIKIMGKEKGEFNCDLAEEAAKLTSCFMD